jgi:hypothetical protein
MSTRVSTRPSWEPFADNGWYFTRVCAKVFAPPEGRSLRRTWHGHRQRHHRTQHGCPSSAECDEMPNPRCRSLRYRTAIGVVVVAGTLAACGLSTRPAVGSFSSNTTSRAPTVVPTVPPTSPRAGSVFSGVKMLGQRDVTSNSDDDPAAYQYRLRYSLDQIDATEAVDPHDQPGFFRTRVTTVVNVFIANTTPHRNAPLIDLRGVIIGGGYKLDRGICHQRNIPLAERNDYCFVGFWVSPGNRGGFDELAVGEARQLGDSSPATWEIPPLARNAKDTLVKDLLSPDLYFIASAGPGYYLVPKNQCTISFDLSSGHAILDTQPRINVCAES